MGRGKWTTIEQYKFLEIKRIGFLRCQKEKTLDSFWPTLYKEWFGLFPLFEPGPGELSKANGDIEKAKADMVASRKQQLYDWFFNHTRNASTGGGKMAPLSLVAKRKHKMSVPQAYYKLFYFKWKATIDAMFEEKRKARAPEDPELVRVSLQNAWLDEFFKKDPPKIKELVHGYRSMHNNGGVVSAEKVREELKTGSVDSALSLLKDLEDDTGMELAEMDETTELKQRQANIHALPTTLKAALAEIEKKTGWFGVVAVCGPCPERGGDISSYIYTTGETRDGSNLDFTTFHKGWEARFMADLGSFAAKVYPEDYRSKCALPGSTSDTDTDTSFSLSDFNTESDSLSTPSDSHRLSNNISSLTSNSHKTKLKPSTPEIVPDDDDDDLEIEDPPPLIPDNVDWGAPITDEEIEKFAAFTKTMSKFEHERERNIAKNKVLMEQLNVKHGIFPPKSTHPKKSKTPATQLVNSIRRSQRISQLSAPIYSVQAGGDEIDKDTNSDASTISNSEADTDMETSETESMSLSNEDELMKDISDTPCSDSSEAVSSSANSRSNSAEPTRTSFASLSLSSDSTTSPPAPVALVSNSRGSLAEPTILLNNSKPPVMESTTSSKESGDSPAKSTNSLNNPKASSTESTPTLHGSIDSLANLTSSLNNNSMASPADSTDLLNDSSASSTESTPSLNDASGSQVEATDLLNNSTASSTECTLLLNDCRDSPVTPIASLNDPKTLLNDSSLSSPEPSVSLHNPEPTWLLEASAYLESVGDTTNWAILTKVYREVEAKMHFPEDSAANRISTKGRPSILGTWMKKRDYDVTPAISHVSQYGEQWREWWISLQPAWRKLGRKEGVRWPLRWVGMPQDENWSGIKKGDENGVFLIILALSWWYKAAKSPKEKKECRSAVDDATWVLQKICL